MASATQSLPIVSSATQYSAAGTSVVAVRLWAKLLFASRARTRFLAQCLLDTGAPICVVPYAYHQTYSFAWQALSGTWPQGYSSWAGVPCTLGQISVWLPIPGISVQRGPFRLIAKFAQASPPGISTPLPILLGLNFLADHRAECSFQCHAIPHAGSIEFP